LWEESYQFCEAHARLRIFFEQQRGELDWDPLHDHASGELLRDLETVVSALKSAGHSRIYRIEMTDPRFAIPVVKVLVPGLRNSIHQVR